MDQLAEVSSRLYKLESRIDDVPTYIKQVILQQINLQQQWVEFKLKHSNEDTSEKGQSEFKKDVQNLEEKIVGWRTEPGGVEKPLDELRVGVKGQSN